MLDLVNKTLNKLFGNKSDKDIKALTPNVELINEHFAKYAALSNDDLRGKTVSFKERINLATKELQDEISALREGLNDDTKEISEKEEIYEQIDKLEKSMTGQIEVVLGEILPEAFAVVKETARRFKENQELEVSATDFDRELANTKAHIRVEGEKAMWKNSWDAAGSEITWDMLHYDVQLIGGMVLHDGKIAEMATGEGKTLVATLPVYLNALSGRGVHLVTVNDYLARPLTKGN